jgi:hypothetical protein
MEKRAEQWVELTANIYTDIGLHITPPLALSFEADTERNDNSKCEDGSAARHFWCSARHLSSSTRQH